MKEILVQEHELKVKKQEMKSLKKRKRQESMQKYNFYHKMFYYLQRLLNEEPIQTPLVDKLFRLNVNDNDENVVNRQRQFNIDLLNAGRNEEEKQ